MAAVALARWMVQSVRPERLCDDQYDPGHCLAESHEQLQRWRRRLSLLASTANGWFSETAHTFSSRPNGQSLV
jgi:hypothetical protein